MRLICGPETFRMKVPRGSRRVVLYGSSIDGSGSAGAAAADDIRREGLNPDVHSWDFLSIALAVMVADLVQRDPSPDGWTRDLTLDVAVSDPAFWNERAGLIESVLAFLTTDRWAFRFHGGGAVPPTTKKSRALPQDSVVLLSGGMDSLVGAIDLTVAGRKPFAVSQIVTGDKEKQIEFATVIGGGLDHLQVNHNAYVPGVAERSQRARSFIFITFGLVAATCLRRYRDGAEIPLYMCENGLIALNPPLTGIRLGSLSTRTAHPEYLARLQRLFDAAGFRVRLENPYQTRTKGEMLVGCADQELLARFAVNTTSCGRFLRYGYRHCGRCVPCQVRRAAFLRWGREDATDYVFRDLGRQDEDHAAFDDVRAVAMALAEVRDVGIQQWVRSRLALSAFEANELEALVARGFAELEQLHERYNVR